MSTPEFPTTPSPTPEIDRDHLHSCKDCGAEAWGRPDARQSEHGSLRVTRERSPPSHRNIRIGLLIQRLVTGPILKDRDRTKRDEAAMSISSGPDFVITDELRSQMTPEDAALVEAYYSTLQDSEECSYEYGT